MKSKALFALGGLAVFALVFAGAIAGTYFANQFSKGGFDTEVPIVLKADSAAGGKSLSMATGLIDRERFVEGLFVLDHLSGNLQCWVLNPQTGARAGHYVANVFQDLELGKGGDNDLVMVVGQFNVNNSRLRKGNQVPAGCLCYVGDGNTGKVVGYSFLYDRQMILRNGVQNAPMTVAIRGIAREAAMTRDN